VTLTFLKDLPDRSERCLAAPNRASPVLGRAGGIAVAIRLVVRSNGRSRRIRVAVIDDDTELLGLMQEVLADEGYDVDLMRGFQEADAHVRATQPDVVICDLVVNNEERGWEIIEMLTLDPKTTGIPLIVCSAAVKSLEERREMLARHGIKAVPKPFDLPELLGAIRESIATRKSADRM
jgi:DNA-binding response OmpR family regulator